MKNSKKIRVVLTGGHAATSGLAVSEEIIRRSGEWEIYWIGARSAFSGKKVKTIEEDSLPKLGVNHHTIVAGKLNRNIGPYFFTSVFKIPLGFIHSFWLLGRIRPHIVLSFGGFVSFPVVFVSWLMRIPVMVHEQTVEAGLANKVSARFSRVVAIARESSRKHFRGLRVKVVGNPLMSGILDVLPKKSIGKPPVLYITCGSRGAQRINTALEAILGDLLKDYKVVHQCGALDYKKFLGIKKKLSKEMSGRYEVYGFVKPFDVADLYREADIVLCRGGAHTVSEVMATCRPSVIVPIPWVQHNEQLKNAKLAEKMGICVVLEEKDMSADNLLESIGKIRKNWRKIASCESNKYSKKDREAAGRIVDLIEKLVSRQ